MRLFLEDGCWIDTAEGIDCSLPLEASDKNPRAWYVDPPVIEPVRANGWTGSVAEGGSVNFRNVFFNPHGHGTHTECLGHITPEVHSVNGCIRAQMMPALLVSIEPENSQHADGTMDQVITAAMLEEALKGVKTEALLVRTLPNDPFKRNRNYSATNPAYFTTDVVELLNEAGVKHLLTDLPSVDREQDGGELAFHHAFWGVPGSERFDRTITELMFVPDEAGDGHYLLNLETAPLVNDATPSRPVIYQIYRGEES